MLVGVVVEMDMPYTSDVPAMVEAIASDEVRRRGVGKRERANERQRAGSSRRSEVCSLQSQGRRLDSRVEDSRASCADCNDLALSSSLWAYFAAWTPTFARASTDSSEQDNRTELKASFLSRTRYFLHYPAFYQ